MMEAKNRIKPELASDLRIVLGGVLFCVMGILALSAGGRGIGILFIAVGVIFGALVLSTYLDSRRALNTLRQSPMTAQATILDRQVKVEKDRYGEREWPTYWVVFRFDAMEGQVTLRARVPQSLCRVGARALELVSRLTGTFRYPPVVVVVVDAIDKTDQKDETPPLLFSSLPHPLSPVWQHIPE